MHDASIRRARLANQVLIFSIIFGLCLTWVLMSEFIQGMQEGWQKPWFILYVIHSGYSLNLVIYWVLYSLRTRDWLMRAHCAGLMRSCSRARAGNVGSSLHAQPFRVPTRQLVYLSIFLALLAAFVGYAW